MTVDPLPSPPDDLVIDADGPGDNTHRPCRPERRALLEAEREKLRRWGGPSEDVIVDADGPGDNTHRPCRPERRALLEAEREKLRRWGVVRKRGQQPAPPAQPSLLEEVLASCLEALSHYRERAKQSPDTDLPQVAIALNDLGHAQRRLNRLEEALASYREALGLYRELAKQRPDDYLPAVAMTLDSLGNVQSDLNRVEESLASYREAIAIRSSLVKQ
jgi:tetratricopeptide (TPR) repeat protein